MKAYLNIAAAAVAVFAVASSCAKITPAEAEKEQVKEQVTLVPCTLTTGDDVKTVLVNDSEKGIVNQIWFHDGDEIAVFDDIQAEPNKFTTHLSSDSPTATFAGKVAEGATVLYVLYPYDADARIENIGGNASITTTLPSVQTLASAGTFDPKANVSVAKVDMKNSYFKLRNIGTLVKFTPADSTYDKATLSSNNGTALAGGVTITDIVATEDNPYLSVSPIDGKKSSVVTTNSIEGSLAKNATYYLAVLRGTHESGITFTLEKGNQEFSTCAKKANAQSTEIGKIDENTKLAKVLNMGNMTETAKCHMGHEYVDLGVEIDGKKVIWSSMNMGATSSKEAGWYIAWGAPHIAYTAFDGSKFTFVTERPSDYGGTGWGWGASNQGFNKNCAPYCNGTNYTKYTGSGSGKDGKTTLDQDDDIAVLNWGSGWRTPTVAQFAALAAQCVWIADFKVNPSSNILYGFYVYKAKDSSHKGYMKNANSSGTWVIWDKNSFTKAAPWGTDLSSYYNPKDDPNIFIPYADRAEGTAVQMNSPYSLYWTADISDTDNGYSSYTSLSGMWVGGSVNSPKYKHLGGVVRPVFVVE